MHLTRRQMMNLEAWVRPGFWPVNDSQHVDTFYRLKRAVIALIGGGRASTGRRR